MYIIELLRHHLDPFPNNSSVDDDAETPRNTALVKYSHDRNSTASSKLGGFGDRYTSASLLVFALRGRSMS